MDLNYLFLRQQVETARAAGASTAEAKAAHEHLARCYEARISRATEGRVRFSERTTDSSAPPSRCSL